MKAKELMLFDLVKRKKDGKVMTVVELRYAETIAAITPDDVYYGDMEDYHESEIDPISLTPEILEKNGFTYCERTGGYYLYTTISYGNWDAEVVLFNVNSEYRNNQLHIGSPDDSDTFLHLMECNHVHQLQHALRLCGIEHEITL